MSSYKLFNYTTFSGVNIKTTAGIKWQGDGGFAGTLAIRSAQDADRQYFLPDKTGTFGVTGTFTVDLPAVAANGYLSTLVTVSGLRVEDAFVVTPQTGRGNAVQSARGAVVITEALTGNGNVTLLFWNITGTATIPMTNQYAYTTVR